MCEKNGVYYYEIGYEIYLKFLYEVFIYKKIGGNNNFDDFYYFIFLVGMVENNFLRDDYERKVFGWR